MLRLVQRNSKNKRKLSFIIIFFIVCFLLLISTFTFFSICKINTIKVEGSKHFTDQEIIDKVLVNRFDENASFLYLKNKYFATEAIPFIEAIDIEVVNRNTVVLVVYEKAIIGCIEYMNENMYFDKDGIIVESSVEKLEDIPSVTGLKFDEIVLHEKLEITNEELYNTILNLTQLIRKYDIHIDKISFDINNEVILTIGDFKVLLGVRESYDEQIAELKNLLEKIASVKPGSLDMKNFKEGQDKIIFKEDQ